MSVEFDEPRYLEKNPLATRPKKTPIMNLVIKLKLAKTPAQANVVMVVICIVFLTAAFIIFRSA